MTLAYLLTGGSCYDASALRWILLVHTCPLPSCEIAHFERRRLIRPPFFPAIAADALSHLWALPCACAAFPPIVAMRLRSSALIDANPRPRCVCVFCMDISS